jgi:hypothetical protein
MLLSDNYMKNVENAGDRVDKLSLLKYVLCCSSEVHIVVDGETTDIVYHPLRNPDNAVLEQSIRFFRYVFELSQCNVREFDLCPFEMVNIADWHISGFPLLMFHKKKSQDLRKAIRGVISKHYWKMTGLTVPIADVNVIMPAIDTCAACQEETRISTRRGKSYDALFHSSWDSIKKGIQHDVLFKKNKLYCNYVLCKRSNTMNITSYKYYRRVSKQFPKVFRHKNRQRYYTRIILLAQEHAQKTDSVGKDEAESPLAPIADEAASDNDDMEEELRKAMEECNDEDSDVNLDDDLCGLGTNSDDDAELSKSPQSTNGDVESDESDSYGVDILLDFKNGVKQCNA